MSIVNLRTVIKSFHYAFRGFRYAYKTEQSFRIQVFIGILVVVLMIFFKVTVLESIVLVLVMTMVLVLELINTVFEQLSDILKPRVHSYVEVIKDVIAAAVLVASIASLAVGLIIFLPYFLGNK